MTDKEYEGLGADIDQTNIKIVIKNTVKYRVVAGLGKLKLLDILEECWPLGIAQFISKQAKR